MQETRLTAGRCRAARNLARSTGWAHYASPAVATGMRGPAPGGVAIAVRRPRGSAPADPGAAKGDATDGRFAACVVEGGPRNAAMAVANVYLDPTPAADFENQSRIVRALAWARGLGHGCWAIAGDWNRHPTAMQPGLLE